MHLHDQTAPAMIQFHQNTEMDQSNSEIQLKNGYSSEYTITMDMKWLAAEQQIERIKRDHFWVIFLVSTNKHV